MDEAKVEDILSRVEEAQRRLCRRVGLEPLPLVVDFELDAAMCVSWRSQPLLKLNPRVLGAYTRFALDGVVAHELGHRILHPQPRLYSLLKLLPRYLGSRLLHSLGLPSLWWRFEHEADAFAVDLVGPAAVASMLAAAVEEPGDLLATYWSHPSRRARLARLGVRLAAA